MKLPLLLTTLFFTSTPALAEDLVYLRCNATAHFKHIDLTEMKVVNEKIDEGVVVHYEIDLNKNLLTDSDDPENPVLVKVQNGMIFSQNSAFTKGRMNVNFFDAQIVFEPPGRINARSTAKANDNSFEVTVDISGVCEASDAETYEASK